MNAIIGMAELLRHEKLSRIQSEYISDIGVSAQSLLVIIDDILDMSKIESGKFELNPVDYDFHAFLDNIASMFKHVAGDKKLKFKFETVGIIPDCVHGDDLRLRQILTNILGNAVKFTKKGNVKLTVTALEDKLLFEIRDTGVGISAEELPNLFDAYEQVDKMKNRGAGGTGLGLSISKSFAEMMGGRITVASEYGHGSAFTVEIPLIEGVAEGAGKKSDSQASRQLRAPGAKILVVDDNKFNLIVAQGLLSLMKIDAQIADSGFKAIEHIKKTDFDIVFMDHMMPEMDGIETVGKIRKMGGKFEKMTIIALTANAVKHAREMFLTRGFDDYIAKPIHADELSELVGRYLPPDKVEVIVTEEASGAARAGDGFIEQLSEIGELNAQIGLSRVSGVETMYKDMLELFYRQMAAELTKLDTFNGTGDMRGFSVTVHAMKSALSTVGAMGLSGLASALEDASKNGDGDYCAAHYGAFKDKLVALRDKLAEVFPDEKSFFKKEKGSKEELPKRVTAAIDAAADYDSDAGLEAVGFLLGFDYGGETNSLLESAAAAFKDFKCTKAAEYLTLIRI
jgi:CheY-like chemotaxis protein